jgi:hypothetical protein
MGAPTFEVSYTSATTRMGDHAFCIGMWWHWKKQTMPLCTITIVPLSALSPRNNSQYNNYYFSPFPSTFLEQILHSAASHFSDSRVCLVDSRSVHFMFWAWCCDVLSGIYYCSNSYSVISPLVTLSRGDPDCFSVQKNHLPFVSVFGKRLCRKSNTVILFPFVFRVAVQQPFKPLWSGLLLHDHGPPRALFAVYWKSLMMSLLPASEVLILECPSSGHLSSSGPCCHLYVLRDTIGSNAAAGLALTVTGTHKPFQHGKVDIPLECDVLR